MDDPNSEFKFKFKFCQELTIHSIITVAVFISPEQSNYTCKSVFTKLPQGVMNSASFYLLIIALVLILDTCISGLTWLHCKSSCHANYANCGEQTIQG